MIDSCNRVSFIIKMFFSHFLIFAVLFLMKARETIDPTTRLEVASFCSMEG
jgi:hypothetical protein